jgi:hypothetical protein
MSWKSPSVTAPLTGAGRHWPSTVANMPNVGHRPDAAPRGSRVTNATPPSVGARSVTDGAAGPVGPIWTVPKVFSPPAGTPRPSSDRPSTP